MADNERDTSGAGNRMRLQAEQAAQQLACTERLFCEAQNLPDSQQKQKLMRKLSAQRDDLLTGYCALLESLNAEYEKRLQQLQAQNTSLRAKNQELEYKLKCTRYELQKALGVKSTGDSGSESEEPAQDTDEDTGEKKKKKKGRGKRGAPKGHRGATRPVPDQVDREEVFAPPQVCECGCEHISPLDDFDVRYIEDIPPVSKIVTREIYLRGRCEGCGSLLRHKEAVAGPPVRIGPNLSVHLTLMNQAGMTFGKLSEFATQVLGIELTPSGALGIVTRVCGSLTDSYRELGRNLRSQDVLNGDETGWKVFGRHGYIWCFCNKSIVYYHPDYHRSSKVIEDILGADFDGVVICDFYAAYNFLSKTQRCLVHLLKDISKEREVLGGSKLLERFDKAVRDFIDEGLRIQAMPEGSLKDNEIKKLKNRLDRIVHMQVTKGRAQTLLKRIDKYRDDLIRFVTHPDIEFHNNRAERQLRPMVITRKISFGSNTDSGALRHCILNSIVQTCKLQGIDPAHYLRRAYLSGGLDVPELRAHLPPAA